MAGYGETALVRGLAFLAEQQSAIANNLANVDTTGFKRRAAVALDTGNRFQSLLDQHLSGVDYYESSDMQRGVLRQTGNRFDVAIDGPHWLRVRDANNSTSEFYTRNGQFQVGTDGRLVTRSGQLVLNVNGQPISLGTADQAPTELVISPNGKLSDPTSGQDFGQIALVELEDTSALSPIGGGLYRDTAGQNGRQGVDVLRQGYLEASNVDSLQELVQMITVERSFSATQKALTGMNRLQQNLITNILR